ncbi:MAG: hypothetical protein H0W82_05670 [Actinobacteria bacterium]|nr:hypothetical protein [Actinomycetota bacterium]
MAEGSGEGTREADQKMAGQRALIASVEELRALLAPLTDDDRARVLDLAHRLADRPGD